MPAKTDYFHDLRVVIGTLKCNVKQLDGCSKTTSKAIEDVETTSVSLLEELIQGGQCDLNCVDENGRSTLHFAALHQNVTITKLLLADPTTAVNLRCKNAGYTPLHYAIQQYATKRDETVLDLLLEDPRTDVNACTDGCKSALHLAVKGPKIVVEKLLACPKFKLFNRIGGATNASPLRNSIRTACTSQDAIDIPLLLIQSGKCDLLETDSSQNTLLHLAAKSSAGIVSSLLQSCEGPELVRAQNTIGNTALHVAAESHSSVIAEIILKTSWCDANKINFDGFAPLHVAARSNSLAVCRLLIENGKCDIHQRDRKSNTILHMIAPKIFLVTGGNGQRACTRLLQYIVALGVYDVDSTNVYGHTPLGTIFKQIVDFKKLMVTSKVDYLPRIKLLISHGATVNTIADGFSLIELLILKDQSAPPNALEIAASLVDAGLDPTAYGSWLAVRAAGHNPNFESVAKLLVSEGTLPRLPDPILSKKSKSTSRCTLM